LIVAGLVLREAGGAGVNEAQAVEIDRGEGRQDAFFQEFQGQALPSRVAGRFGLLDRARGTAEPLFEGPCEHRIHLPLWKVARSGPNARHD
jgi:hypothetical protein